MLDHNPRIVRRLSFIPIYDSGKIVRSLINKELNRKYIEHKLTIARAHKAIFDILLLKFQLLCLYVDS